MNLAPSPHEKPSSLSVSPHLFSSGLRIVSCPSRALFLHPGILVPAPGLLLFPSSFLGWHLPWAALPASYSWL